MRVCMCVRVCVSFGSIIKGQVLQVLLDFTELLLLFFCDIFKVFIFTTKFNMWALRYM